MAELKKRTRRSLAARIEEMNDRIQRLEQKLLDAKALKDAMIEAEKRKAHDVLTQLDGIK